MSQTTPSSHPVRNIVITVLVAIVIIGLFVFSHLQNQVTLYEDPNTEGNTSGNLLNGGLFCLSGDTIYFSNSDDDSALYSMNTNLEKPKKLIDDKASYINAAGKYVFYSRRNDQKSSTGEGLFSLSTTGLFRIANDGKNLSKIYDDPTQVVNLHGNFLYYQHYDQKEGLQLYSAKIDGSSDDQLSEESVAPYSVEDGLIYYTGWDSDHMIHTMNINGSDDNVLYDGNCTSLIKVGSHLYYMDMQQNYALVRINLDGSEPETLVSNRIATYNVDETESTVYYQVDDGKNNGLYRLDLENNETELLAEGDYNYLHLISNYLFYKSFSGDTMYVMDLATERSETFSPKSAK